VDISYFDQDTEQSNDTCQNAEIPNRISELLAALAIVEVEPRCAEWISHRVVTADRRLSH